MFFQRNCWMQSWQCLIYFQHNPQIQIQYNQHSKIIMNNSWPVTLNIFQVCNVYIMNLIENVCTQIVSPMKFTYSTYDLGNFNYHSGRRYDFIVYNYNHQKLNCSFYKTIRKKSNWCVVYLHSMNGTRLQSISYVQTVMNLGFNFCNFDFSGCGNSEGNSISFGVNQKYDVSQVLDTLRQKYKMQRIILWGRSMGAVCAIKYCQMISQNYQHNLKVEGLILDSPFKSLQLLAIQIGKYKTGLPSFFIQAAFRIIKSTIEEKGKFKMEELELQNCINKLSIPIIFMASLEDLTIKSYHSQDLFNVYQYNKKQLILIKGVHNASRDHQYVNHIKNFLTKIQKNPINHRSGHKKINIQKLLQNSDYLIKQSESYQNETCLCSSIFKK